MKPTALLASALSLLPCTTAMNLTYTNPSSPDNTIHPLDQPRVIWETSQKLDLALFLVKKEADTKHWPLGFSFVESQSDFIRLRLDAGHGEWVFWDIPKGLSEKAEYAFYMEGWDTEQDYAMNMLDNGTTNWFSITKYKTRKEELRRNQVWVA